MTMQTSTQPQGQPKTATSSPLGFTRDLFILPFDHRGSFQEKLFGIKGRAPTPAEKQEIVKYKKIIFEGFKKAVAASVPANKAGILVDEEFGSEILWSAQSEGYMTACPVEKSGQDEFDFEYGDQFDAHIRKFSPTFAKVLVRYNPDGALDLNRRQAERLKRLSEYCHKNHTKFMFELLVPPTPEQMAKVDGVPYRYDRELRPALMIRAMKELQDAGVEPDVWKVEGIESEADSKKVAEQVQSGAGRKQVGIIVLGRGENEDRVKHWLKTAAKVPGLIGFAVGRTIFWDALKAVKEGKISKEEAAQRIGEKYKGFCDLWIKARE